jgi:hypothetical protein
MVDKANEFSNRAENLIIAKKEFPLGERNRQLLGYWSLAFDIHRGTLCLITQNLYGSAFALLRPAVEAVIRAHVAAQGSESDLRLLDTDKYKTNFSTIGKWIDVQFGYGSLFENFLRTATNGLHSYTHAGALQMDRRFKGAVLVADYFDEELKALIQASLSGVFLVNGLVARHFNCQDEWEQTSELLADWAKASGVV